MRNMIHGGVRIFRILDEDENEIFVEESQDYDTVRPHFIITGSETEERVRRIASWLDPEIEDSALLFPSYGGHDFRAYCQFYLCVDGKITRMWVFSVANLENIN